MTHCLFARGLLAYTVKMELRFRQPVVVGISATVHATVIHARPPWYRVRAEVVQQETARATAEAVFHGRSAPREGLDRPSRP